MAYLALYRKYRPKTFDEVIGQESITRILKNQIQYNRVGHAYLFSGIRGTGKTSLAKIFAKAINCPNGIDGNPCNTCEICINIDRSGVMDIIEIDGASNRGVDEIREIREKVKYPPTVGRYKVYIIDEVHMLTKEAFNALLKTLEEPPEHVVFILATTEPNKCPATILSRCQRYEIRPIPKALIIGQMEKICQDLNITMESQALDFIAVRGENSMRDALSLLDQIVDLKDSEGHVSMVDLLDFTGMADKSGIHNLVKKISAGDSAGVLLCLREMVTRGKDSILLMDQVIECIRGVLITKTAGETAVEILGCTPEDYQDFNALAETLAFNRLYKMISHLIEEKNKLKYSTLQSIIVEMAFLRLCLKDDVVYEQTIIMPADRKKAVSIPKTEINEPINKSIETMPEVSGLESPEINEKNTAYFETADKEVPMVLEAKPEIKQPINETAAVTAIEKTNKFTKHDEMKLFKKLCDDIGKTNSAQAMFLKRGEPNLQGEDHLILTFSTENQNFFHFVNKPELVQTFETVLTEATGKKITVSIKLEEENFGDLDMIEKTRRIINNDEITIVEVDECKEK
ncbi:DNA polymerase III subunit gamma/tau [Acetobacterium bakii]|uniref:DNA-directed DNA polymerase n=1 Tax=Acetobacterium bakii TaxID=52689 RepID=A0A0L6TYN8_9FIRM|nr:DNA polymerase III subunit gamma/tau [Acetobacterium bakii]KNZ41348.1 DNA polymerase III subunits gamma and tau [Acetobacterium bakii]